MDELDALDAMGMAEWVRSGKISEAELMRWAVERIDKTNPAINAVITPMFSEAASQLEAGLPDGPFRGVPYLVKDILAAVKGVRYTGGSRLLEDYVSDHDSTLVQRLRRAGFVFLGKTNTPEFGFLPTTESELHGPCKNPWDLGRTTGGSSGGTAAAVAARLVPAAHGNDGGGSIRIPAACCGLFGLKPTRGRITLGPDFGDIMGGMVCEHALTRSVRDSAAILDATQGGAPGDPYVAPPPARPYLDEVGAPPGQLKIAMTKRAATSTAVHADCVAAVEDTARLCEELGHVVEEQDTPISGDLFARAFIVLWTAGAALSLDGTAMLTGRQVTRDNVEPLSYALAEAGRSHSASSYLMAVALLQRLCREMGRFMQKYDVWLTPTLAEPPLPLGSFDAPADNPMAALMRAAEFAPFTPLQNATGDPAMSIPLYWNQDGLPIGVQFAARQGGEATLFRLAAQLEEARPWATRRPPHAA